MEIRKRVEIRSPDTKWILDKKLRRNVPYIEGIMLKLSRIYKLASTKQALYAYMSLSNTLGEIYQIKQSLQKSITDFEKIFDKQKIDLSSIEIPVLEVHEFRIGMPLLAELVNVIEMYDRAYCLFKIADKFNLFKDRYRSFASLSRNHRRIMKTFGRALSIEENKISNVSVKEYIDQAEAYLKAKETLGEVKPAELYAALNIDMFPRLPSGTRNLIIHKLKHMG